MTTILTVPNPSYEQGWLQGFSRGMDECAKRVLKLIDGPDGIDETLLRKVLIIWASGNEIAIHSHKDEAIEFPRNENFHLMLTTETPFDRDEALESLKKFTGNAGISIEEWKRGFDK